VPDGGDEHLHALDYLVYAALQLGEDRTAAGVLEAIRRAPGATPENFKAAYGLEDATQKHPVTPGAVLPARELLADLLLLQGEPRLAEAEYRRVLTATPNRFRSVFGAGRAAEAAGDSLTARQFYAELVAQCREADLDRAELARARAFLSARRAAR
jgi:hypothetical protein